MNNTITMYGNGCRTGLLVAVTTALFGGLAQPAPVIAQQAPPAALPIEELSFPPFDERMFANGADAIIVEHKEQPFVTVSLYLKAGSSSDARNQVGAASMVAQMLNKGTTTRSALDIAEAMDFVGASLSAGAAADWTSVSLGVMPQHLELGLEIMADVVMNPSFPEDELELLRTQTLTGLQLQLSQAGALANRAFIQAVYGRHPYGKLETPATVERMSQRTLRNFHRANYKPTNALFVVAGDVDTEEVAALLESAFGAWEPGSTRQPTYFAPPRRDDTEVILVHKPGSVQSSVRVGHLLMKGNEDGWTPLSVGTRILGGGSTGRLFKILREERSWTYGAGASANRRKDVGVFQASMDVRNEVTDSAVAELLAQMELIRTEMVPAPELNDMKDFMVGSFPRSIETPQQIANQVASYRLQGRTQQELEGYRERVSAVGAIDVRDALAEHLDPGKAVIVIVGDGTEVYNKVVQFGPVHMQDVEGKRLTVDDITVSASDVALDGSILEPGTWVYQISARGQVVGEMNRSLSRREVEGSQAMRLLSTTSAGPVTVTQETVFVPRTFRAISASMRQSFGGQERRTEMQVEGARLVGTSSGPQESRDIDREWIPGALIGDMDELAVWVADLASGEEIKVPVMSMRGGSASNLRIKPKGTTEIEVPAGTFQVYEVEFSGGPAGTQRAYFMVAAPHILVKQGEVGQPIVELLRIP